MLYRCHIRGTSTKAVVVNHVRQVINHASDFCDLYKKSAFNTWIKRCRLFDLFDSTLLRLTRVVLTCVF